MAYARHSSSRHAADTVALGLGWLSIGLGLVEIFAPRRLTQTLGMEGSETLLRAYGAREIASGIGILTTAHRAPWLWSRVGGDALDIATLLAGMLGRNRRRNNLGIALAAVAGITVLDLLCAQKLSAVERKPRRPRFDYSNRSGLPHSPQVMRGAARDFEIPRDMRIPTLLRPYTTV